MIEPFPRHVAIIGAGPSGLCVAKYLLEYGPNDIEVVIYEVESELGGTFRYRTYEGGELVSSKQLTSYSDFRFPLEQNDHVPVEVYVDYLLAYAKTFNVYDKIHFRTEVISVRKHLSTQDSNSIYRVRTRGVDGVEREQIFDAVAVCSGLHFYPYIPKIPNNNYDGQVIHSSDYKQKSEFHGKRVLIAGTGETAMDLIADACGEDETDTVTLSAKQGWLSFPRQFPGFRTFWGWKTDGDLPIDTVISNLFENAYVHRWNRQHHMRWHFSDFFVRRTLGVLTGTTAGCGQWVGQVEKPGRAYNILNKSTRAMPYLNKGHKQKYFTERFVELDVPDPDRKAYMKPRIASLGPGRTVEFVDDSLGHYDLVVLATGYQPKFPFLSGTEATDRDMRMICNRNEPKLGFFGFIRPGVGAIPPMAEMQAMWWIQVLRGEVKPEYLEPEYFHLDLGDNRRIDYGVDYSSYVYGLAKDMGATPTIWELVTMRMGFWETASFILGPAFPAYFRMKGPFYNEQCRDVVTGELWEVITRRGFAGNFFMAIIPIMFYGPVNIALFIIEYVLSTFALVSWKPDTFNPNLRKYKAVPRPGSKSKSVANGTHKFNGSYSMSAPNGRVQAA
eukprot:Clim_evm12s66 gene=Clim_evmTU12s66